MSIITTLEGKALHAIGSAVAGGLKPDASGGNIIAELEQFAIDLVAGTKASISYKLPTEKVSTTFSWEGKTWNFTAEVIDGSLKIVAAPQ